MKKSCYIIIIILSLFYNYLNAQKVLVDGEKTGYKNFLDKLMNTKENINVGRFYLEAGQTININLTETNGNKFNSFVIYSTKNNSLVEEVKFSKINALNNYEFTAKESGFYKYEIVHNAWKISGNDYTIKIILKGNNIDGIGKRTQYLYHESDFTDNSKTILSSKAKGIYKEGDFRFYTSFLPKIDTTRAITIFNDEAYRVHQTEVLLGSPACLFPKRQYFIFYAGDTILVDFKNNKTKQIYAFKIQRRMVELETPIFDGEMDGNIFDGKVGFIVKESGHYYIEINNTSYSNAFISLKLRRIPGSTQTKNNNCYPETKMKAVSGRYGYVGGDCCGTDEARYAEKIGNTTKCCCMREFSVMEPIENSTSSSIINTNNTQKTINTNPTNNPTTTNNTSSTPTSGNKVSTPNNTSPSGFTNYSTKTTEKLEAMKKEAVAKSDFDAAAAVKTELDLRKAETELLANKQKELDEKVKAEDFAGASTLQKELKPLKEKIEKKNNLRTEIENAVKVQDFEKAESLKQELKSLY